MTPIFTIGHSTLPLPAFLELLAENGVRVLVDVRRFPSSRRHPHFAGKALAASLKAAGMDYRHEEGLGGHRTPRPDSPNQGWRNEAFRGYADHMATPAFRAALERVAGLPAVTAVMCAEAVPGRCHRQLIADALLARDLPVVHILGPARVEPHRLSPGARIQPDGGLVYPREPGAGGGRSLAGPDRSG